jgi:uncharacterized cupredoxin-like copper-binding protein
MSKTKVAALGFTVVAVLASDLPAGAWVERVRAATATTVVVIAGQPSEFEFKLSRLTVPTGTVTFRVTNSGDRVHDFKILNRRTKNLAPGQSQSITVTFARAGKYPFFCTVAGHAAAGMKGLLTAK